MRSSSQRGVLALNIVLLAVLALVVVTRDAGAGAGQPQRARGQYTMVGGDIVGGNTNAIYVLDSVNQELVAIRWSESQKRLEGIGYRDLAADARASGSGTR